MKSECYVISDFEKSQEVKEWEAIHASLADAGITPYSPRGEAVTLTRGQWRRLLGKLD